MILTLTYTDAEQVQHRVPELLKRREVDRVQVDELPKSLNHGCRQPYAQIFLCAESRQLRVRLEHREDGEQEFLANGIPEIDWERGAVFCERGEKRVQRPAIQVSQSKSPCCNLLTSHGLPGLRRS